MQGDIRRRDFWKVDSQEGKALISRISVLTKHVQENPLVFYKVWLKQQESQEAGLYHIPNIFIALMCIL